MTMTHLRSFPRPKGAAPESPSGEAQDLDRERARLRAERRALEEERSVFEQEVADAARTLAGDLGRATDRAIATGNPSEVARAIIRAGAKRRGEIDDTPEPSGIAGEIVKAAKRRRGELP
jgi:hypothetical protein